MFLEINFTQLGYIYVFREFFSKYVGEDNAQWVNTEFESKLLLKNQKQGMVTWAKKIGGLKEQARRDILSKIEKLDKALSPQEEDSFLEDIVIYNINGINYL